MYLTNKCYLGIHLLSKAPHHNFLKNERKSSNTRKVFGTNPCSKFSIKTVKTPEKIMGNMSRNPWNNSSRNSGRNPRKGLEAIPGRIPGRNAGRYSPENPVTTSKIYPGRKSCRNPGLHPRKNPTKT